MLFVCVIQCVYVCAVGLALTVCGTHDDHLPPATRGHIVVVVVVCSGRMAGGRGGRLFACDDGGRGG